MRTKTTIALALVAAFVVAMGCAGRKDVTAMDKSDQAFIDLRNQVRLVITDTDRQARIVELISALQADIEQLGVSYSGRQTRIRELNANYDATREDFVALIEERNREVAEARLRVSRQYETLSEYTTPAEREQLNKYRSKAISAALSAMRSI